MTERDPAAPDAQHAAIKEFFTEDRESWRTRYEAEGFTARTYQLRARHAFALLDSASKGAGGRNRLLDVGCGAAVQAQAAALRGWAVVGLDMTPAMLHMAAREAAGPACVCAAAESLPFAARSFRAVMMLGLIGYVVDPLQTLREARRLMLDDGVLIVSWWNRQILLSRLSDAVSLVPNAVYRSLRRITARQTGKSSTPVNFFDDHNRPWKGRDFHWLLAEAGFRLDEERVVNFGRLHFMGKRLLPEWVDSGISRAFEALAHQPPLRVLRRWARIHVALARPVTD